MQLGAAARQARSRPMARLLVLLLPALTPEATILSAPRRAPFDREILLRPRAGRSADIVQYGIFCQSVSGINMLDGTFNVDLVISLHWTDPRAAKVVPAGVTEVNLSERFAKEKIWVPDATIANRYINAVDAISTAFQINVWGNVTKVQRVTATIVNSYDVTDFPFDKQVLSVKISSASLMSEELQFAPFQDPTLMGVADGVFSTSDFSLISASAAVVDEIDGDLRKSRGTLSIKVERRVTPYLQTHIVHELLLMFIAWSVYWYPLTAPFAMPRVFTALISFLTLLTLGMKTSTLIPVNGSFSWMALFEMNCQGMMFMNVFLNIFILVVCHTYGHKQRAEMLEKEVFIFFPSMSFIIFSICIATSAKIAPPRNLAFICNLLMTIAFLGFLGFETWQLKKAIAAKDTSMPLRKWINSVPCPT